MKKYVLTLVDENIVTSVLLISDSFSDCQKKMVEAVAEEIRARYHDDYIEESYKDYPYCDTFEEYIDEEIIKSYSKWCVVLHANSIDYDRIVDELTFEINCYEG